MSKNEAQVTVRIPAPLHEFIAERASREDRSLAGQIRHLLAQAARQAEQQTSAEAA